MECAVAGGREGGSVTIGYRRTASQPLSHLAVLIQGDGRVLARDRVQLDAKVRVSRTADCQFTREREGGPIMLASDAPQTAVLYVFHVRHIFSATVLWQAKRNVSPGGNASTDPSEAAAAVSASS